LIFQGLVLCLHWRHRQLEKGRLGQREVAKLLLVSIHLLLPLALHTIELVCRNYWWLDSWEKTFLVVGLVPLSRVGLLILFAYRANLLLRINLLGFQRVTITFLRRAKFPLFPNTVGNLQSFCICKCAIWRVKQELTLLLALLSVKESPIERCHLRGRKLVFLGRGKLNFLSQLLASILLIIILPSLLSLRAVRRQLLTIPLLPLLTVLLGLLRLLLPAACCVRCLRAK